MTATFPIILKGGGYGGHHILGGAGVRLRHHSWTGTTDNQPYSDGVPPRNGGLPPEPDWRERFKRWIKWVAKGGK
jgi:hypothetical protein